jgi:multidrug efflux pump subunit AcrB
VARVEDGLNDVRRLARMTGEPGVSIGIAKQRGSNEVKVGQAVKARMAELQQTLPEGMKMQVNVDFTQFVEEAVKATEHELLLAGALTALICFLFLGTFSSGFNVILSIPTSIVGTFTILYFSRLHAEHVHPARARAGHRGGGGRRDHGAGEHRAPFPPGQGQGAGGAGRRARDHLRGHRRHHRRHRHLPARRLHVGVIGRFFYQFGITITAAVALSLLEAITLTPMRLSQMLVRRDRPPLLERAAFAVFDVLARAYRATLTVALNLRWLVLPAAVAIFAGSLHWGRLLNREFVPSQDQNFIRMSMQLPVGSSLALSPTARPGRSRPT